MSDLYDGYRRLRFDRPHPRVLRITIDNPGKMNSIDEVMHPEMVRIWHDISNDDSVASVILTGAGDAFCAGGNFEMVQEMVDKFEVRMKNLREARDVVYNMINCTKPIISAVRGPAVGGGLVCATCAPMETHGPRALSVRALKSLRYLLVSNFDGASLLRVDEALATELERHLRSFMQHVLDRDINAARLLDELARMPRPAPATT